MALDLSSQFTLLLRNLHASLKYSVVVVVKRAAFVHERGSGVSRAQQECGFA